MSRREYYAYGLMRRYHLGNRAEPEQTKAAPPAQNGSEYTPHAQHGKSTAETAPGTACTVGVDEHDEGV